MNLNFDNREVQEVCFALVRVSMGDEPEETQNEICRRMLAAAFFHSERMRAERGLDSLYVEGESIGEALEKTETCRSPFDASWFDLLFKVDRE